MGKFVRLDESKVLWLWFTMVDWSNAEAVDICLDWSSIDSIYSIL